MTLSIVTSIVAACYRCKKNISWRISLVFERLRPKEFFDDLILIFSQTHIET
jgi:hypothetical protein